MDTLQRFLFENTLVRGELIELPDTWRQVQARHDYPPAVQTLLGEMLAAAALLAANLKFNGMLIMQVHGDGPVRLLVVECDSDLRLRATAKLTPGAVLEGAATLRQLLNANGRGRFVITLDPADKLPGQQAYQGVVPLDGDSVAEVIEHYMQRSEQLDTRLWLAADDTTARGLLLQRLPGSGGDAPMEQDPERDPEQEHWNRAVTLASTLGREEMLATDIASLMHRLFWEETLRLFEPKHPRFHCGCTRDKVGNMLKMLGRPEIDSALEELGLLKVNCDFCGQGYEFDRVDCAQLFASDAPVETLLVPGTAKH